jgi:oligoendopeptidase F
MNTELKHSEVPIENTWDLTLLYKSENDWEKDFASLDTFLADFNVFKGKLGDSPEVLRQAYEKSDNLDRFLEKIYVYVHLLSDEDIADSANMGKLNRVTAKFAEISGETSWFDPEILALPQELLKAYTESDELAFYRRSLEELLRDKPHTLSAPEEKILGMASDALSTPSKAFSALNNADIKFPEVPDGKGKKVPLSHGLYSKLLENSEREIRKAAFDGMYDTFKDYRNVLTTTLDGAIKTHVLNSRIRKFDSALQASLHNDNVPQDVYDNLIGTVHNHLPVFHRYLELRRKVFGLDEINMYDLHNPMIPECKLEVEWDEACDMVGKSLTVLGDEYSSILSKAFTDRWIDIPECKGKRSGAYSSGCYDSVPYILMNFNGTLNHVFTLAHELGHSMHSYYSKHAQEYHYADYRIFVAEVASTTNELLLHDSLIKSSDDKKFKLYLLNHLADGIRGTVYRQTMFAEFEKMIHAQLEEGTPLTADGLSESYFNLNAKYHGPGMQPDQKIEMEWARIPHFYYNFYVYKYATGFSAAAALSKGILEGDQDKIDAYISFLKAGSTKDVLDILKDAGVDMTTSAPVDATMQLFASTVDELERGML